MLKQQIVSFLVSALVFLLVGFASAFHPFTAATPLTVSLSLDATTDNTDNNSMADASPQESTTTNKPHNHNHLKHSGNKIPYKLLKVSLQK